MLEEECIFNKLFYRSLFIMIAALALIECITAIARLADADVERFEDVTRNLTNDLGIVHYQGALRGHEHLPSRQASPLGEEVYRKLRRGRLLPRIWQC